MKHKYPKERSKPKSRIKVYYALLDSIKQEGRLPKMDMSKQALHKYVSRLKKEGKIRKVGHGVWELVNLNSQQPWVTNHSPMQKHGVPVEVKVRSDDVRVHDLVFKLRVETPLSWESRLKARDVHFEPLKAMPGVLQVVHDGHKVWLCQGKVIIYIPPGLDYTARKVSKGLLLAVKDFFSFIPGLEAYLGVSLRSGQGYVWSLDRKHLSLVKNALAQDYNRRKEKLKVYDEAGLWMIADDSFNLGELEFVRSSTNQGEANKVQAWLNDFKKNPVLTSEMMMMLKAESFNIAQLTDALAQVTVAVQVIREVLEKR